MTRNGLDFCDWDQNSPMNDVTTAALLFSGVGVLFIALGIPLFRGRVRPNAWYGCRTTKTLSDEKIWYAVNRVTGRDMIAAGIAALLGSLVVFLIRGYMNSNIAAAVLLTILLLGVAMMVVNSLKTQRQM
jgi:uncharacterized membrane protein